MTLLPMCCIVGIKRGRKKGKQVLPHEIVVFVHCEVMV